MKKVILVIITLLCVSGILADGAKYLIIAPDSFVQAVQPLADWKTKKGVKAMVVPLSVTGNTALQIKNYILNGYNNWEIRPEYILLAGLGTVVPYYSSSDDYFANMTGNYQIELSIGRFPCISVDQINKVVAKTLSYERTLFLTDTTWFIKGTSVVREGSYAEDDDSMYWANARYIMGLWQSANYTHIDSLSRLRGDSARHVENAITDGRAYVVYQGAAVANWWNPFPIDTARINNGLKLPIIISATSATMSLTSSGYLGDILLNAGTAQNPKGVVGFWGTNGIGSHIAIYRGVVAKGFFSSVFEDGIYKLGDAAKKSKIILDSLYHIQTRYQEWNLYGDPELNLWTAVPKPLSVTYDSIIHPTPCSVTVSVLSNGIAVRNALICLMKDSTIYECGYSNGYGIKAFSIAPQDTGTISITVTARNCHPFEGVIRVLPED